MTLFHFIVAGFAALFPLVNPVGGVAIYASMSSHLDPAEKRKQAIKTAMYIFILLAVFGLLGPLILKGLGLTIPALQLAGGLIVGAAGFGMINPKPEHEENIKSKHEGKQDISFSPMALPMLAGPGAIGAVIALGARNGSVETLIGLTLGYFLLALLTGVLLYFATPLFDKLKPGAIDALTRIMGFLILAIGTQIFIGGLHDWLIHVGALH
ncbi:MarC family protein [Corynebacterium falsenii]|uniref:MarC family protein n=1 Tax=Corynebacterium falsenii TaxID=108486 RepID=UPI001DD5D55C|nr:MarC family protein [Corynebacterium falsenii]HJF11335.1 MarC family protein [Corynebacterium falsenii]